MKKELQDKLVAAYSEIFQDVGGDPSQTCMADGLNVGDGWYDLIDALCSRIKDHVERALDTEPVVALQVKEKLGTLRFYYRGGDDLVQGLVSMAEAMSAKICEDCGNPGKLRRGSWWKTLCPGCHVHRLERAKKPLTSL